jgi:hypothetical protein
MIRECLSPTAAVTKVGTDLGLGERLFPNGDDDPGPSASWVEGRIAEALVCMSVFD